MVAWAKTNRATIFIRTETLSLTILLFSRDLLASSSLTGAAQASGHSLESVDSLDALVEQLEQTDVGLIVVDLSAPGCDIEAIVQSAHTGAKLSPTVIAFGPHVHKDRLEAAVQAGCDEVLSRGQFFRTPTEIFRRHLGEE